MEGYNNEGSETSSCFSSVTSFNLEKSTSGCSSEFDKKQHLNMMKKERCQNYMTEIKKLIPRAMDIQNRKSKNSSTLSTLKQFLDYLKEIQQDGSGQKLTSHNGADSSIPDLRLSEIDSDIEEWTVFVSCDGLNVVDVSKELVNALGFTKKTWLGRSISSFVVKRDVATLNNNLDQWLHKDSTEKQDVQDSRSFYLRFRKPHKISNNYAVKCSDYMPFKAKVVTRIDQNKLTAFWSPANCETGNCFSIKLTPCVSAYVEEGLSIDRCFTVQHSSQGLITCVSKNTVNLLGYLPQDLLGSTFTMLYDIQEFKLLHTTYKSALESKGQPYKGSRMRLKTKSDEWITVESDWICFVSPWSNCVDTILAKYRVVSVPDDPDVFKEKLVSKRSSNPENMNQVHISTFERKILKLFSVPENVSHSSLSLSASKDSKDNTAFEYHLYDVGGASSSDQRDRKRIELERETSPDSIPTDNIGQHIYTYNIRRFLQSQPLTLSEFDNNEQEDSDCKVVVINIPSSQAARDSSCSVKLNTSDVDAVIGSPHESSDNSMDSVESVLTNSYPVQHVNLTQAALREHTKLQKELYTNKMQIELPQEYQNSIIVKVPSTPRKRNLDLNSSDEFPQHKKHTLEAELKSSRYLYSSVLPVGNLENNDVNIAEVAQQPTCNYALFPQHSPLLPHGHQTEWPYYTNQDCSFAPSMMGGFIGSTRQDRRKKKLMRNLKSHSSPSRSMSYQKLIGQQPSTTMSKNEMMRYEMPNTMAKDLLRKDKKFLKSNQINTYFNEQFRELITETDRKNDDVNVNVHMKEDLQILGDQFQNYMESRVLEVLASSSNNLEIPDKKNTKLCDNSKSNSICSEVSDKVISDISDQQSNCSDSNSSLKESDCSNEIFIGKPKLKKQEPVRDEFFNRLFRNDDFLEQPDFFVQYLEEFGPEENCSSLLLPGMYQNISSGSDGQSLSDASMSSNFEISPVTRSENTFINLDQQSPDMFLLNTSANNNDSDALNNTGLVYIKSDMVTQNSGLTLDNSDLVTDNFDMVADNSDIVTNNSNMMTKNSEIMTNNLNMMTNNSNMVINNSNMVINNSNMLNISASVTNNSNNFTNNS